MGLRLNCFFQLSFDRFLCRLAYSSKGDYVKAAESYKKAISIEPNNTNFKENLAIAESQLRESGNTSVGGLLGGLGGAGGLDFNTIMNNPMMQSMAQRLMSDPNMQSTWVSMWLLRVNEYELDMG